MSIPLASLMFVLLLAVSVAHLLWSMGQTWPIRDEKLLAQTVIGFRDIERMPPRLTSFAVALATLAAGVLALSLADHDSGGPLLTLVGVLLAAIFLARGIIGYTAWWADKTPQPNFRLNDRRVYSPLCLLLGTGYVVLVIMRLL
ncbi:MULTISPECIES: DUF3995 domain-containing protein [Devosia]|uniref:DUF3995 domain-containing protein n=1 Tax=Devosia TaxID=46913 RepID=UPI0027334576|nr:DUF3995 domain-containing protein [Devosia sp.]MDP2782306.1 DUF3995 domain-containing protein [Devosia sp.]HLV84819.1 DUF3995 domain-containing protein [Devosia sp.]